jgi:hypothetical protein
MDDMGTPGPNHPAHRGLKAPDNVVKMPGMGMRKARLFKNNMLDAVLGPVKVTYNEDHDDDDSDESHLDNYINSSIENSGHSEELNQMLGRNNNDFHEARIISMGKFKEDKANRELMEKNSGE